MTFFLRDLLYYTLPEKKNGDLKKSLIEYQLLLSAFAQSIEALEKGDLEKFDSLVGENACQIRAIRMALIHRSYTPDSSLQESLSESIQKIDHILESKIVKLMQSGCSLEEVFNIYSLDIPLSCDQKFFLKSYILSEMKEKLYSETIMDSLSRKEKCSPGKIKKFNSQVSLNFTDKLATHLRKLLSKASVKYVQELAGDLEDKALSHMVSSQFTYEHNSLHCIPMFWSCKILLQTAQNKEIPLIAHVKFLKEQENGYLVTHEKHFFFKPVRNNDDSISYKETTLTETDLNKASCIVQGVACAGESWDKEAFLRSITDTILAGAADHRQYPNPDHPLGIDCQEFEHFKSLALTHGFSFENPKTFFIQHVYSSQVQKALAESPVYFQIK